MSKSIITFSVDDRKFVLSRNTFQNHPESLLTQVVNLKVSDKSIVAAGPGPDHKSLFYVDRDPEAFKYVVDCLRGYDFNVNDIENKNLRNKVIHDLEYFNLPINTIYLNIPEDIEKIKFGSDALEDIMNNTDDINKEDMLQLTNDLNEQNTPLLTQFIDILSKKEERSEKSNNKESEKNNETTKQLIDSLNQNLDEGSISIELMHALSNDENIKQLIKQFQDTISSPDSSSRDDNDDNLSEDSEDPKNHIVKTNVRYIEIE